MFKRKAYQELLRWKTQSNGKTALLIEGARRVGKTTIAEELGKKEYPAFHTIDFSVAADAFKKHFENLLNLDDFFAKLFLDLRISPLPAGSLLIFDEIQFCPKARQAIKTLVRDGRYHYIETGSLLSIKENTEDILIPSEEESIQMYPMDYEEFLWAIGSEYEANLLRDGYEGKRKLDQSMHQSLMQNFRLYLAIGGMPKVLASFLANRDFYAADKEKKAIINLYEEDLRKIDNKYGTICYTVWKHMPFMLSGHSSRFSVSSVDERADSVLFANTMNKLEESKMVIPVFRCKDPLGGFELTKDQTMFKLYFSDVGLFTSLIYAQNKNDNRDVYQRLVLDKLSANFGMLYENYVAQCLVANGFMPFYYSWAKEDEKGNKAKYEIDFLINVKGKTTPIEVKSKRVSSLSSLTNFKQTYGKAIGEKLLVKPKPFSRDSDCTNLPTYMLFALQ